jgi:O-antigen/teichoic acid export membrane protein
MSRVRDRRIGLALAALPTGTVPVGIALVVAGAAAYGFQIVAFRVLGSEEYAALNGLWVTAFVLAPGLFLPLEQEVARAVAHRYATGLGSRPLIRRAVFLGVVLVVGTVAVLLLGRGIIEQKLLRGSDGLFLALIAVLVGFAVMSLARGVLSGNGRFGRYGLVVGVDGASRVLLAAGIAIVGFGTLGWFGVAFCIAPFIASAAGLIGARGLGGAGPAAPMSELSTAIGWLLLGSTFAQALSYSAYIGASVLATRSQDAELGAFIAGLFIARIPLLLFQAVQAALLPKLAGLLGRGQVAEFRHGLTRLVLLVSAGSVIGVLIALTAGPHIGRALFGAKFTLSGTSLAALTAGVCLVVIALTLAQAMIALQRYAITACAWVLGVAVFVAVMAVGESDVFTRSEIAFLAGGIAAVVWMAIATWHALKSVPPGEQPVSKCAEPFGSTPGSR